MSEPRAFPTITIDEYGDGHTVRRYHGGMTLRDFFAAKALPVMVSNEESERAALPVDYNEAADRAYAYADAMLRARGRS